MRFLLIYYYYYSYFYCNNSPRMPPPRRPMVLHAAGARWSVSWLSEYRNQLLLTTHATHTQQSTHKYNNNNNTEDTHSTGNNHHCNRTKWNEPTRKTKNKKTKWKKTLNQRPEKYNTRKFFLIRLSCKMIYILWFVCKPSKTIWEQNPQLISKFVL